MAELKKFRAGLCIARGPFVVANYLRPSSFASEVPRRLRADSGILCSLTRPKSCSRIVE